MQTLEMTIQNDIATEKVLVYSKASCPFCSDAEEILKNGNVQYKIYQLDQMPNGS